MTHLVGGVSGVVMTHSTRAIHLFVNTRIIIDQNLDQNNMRVVLE
jgi:hypothetical protein